MPRVGKVRYAYSAHLSPVLRFDETGRADSLIELTDTATKRPLTSAEAKRLREAESAATA